MALDIGPALTTFALVLFAELPDKTFFATLVLATRLRPIAVWAGVVTAFGVQCVLAVTAGGLLTLLPRVVVLSASALLFAIGAAVMIHGGLRSRAEERAMEAEEEADTARTLDRRTGTDGAPAGLLRSAAISAGVLFVAELGDLSQVLTVGLAARFDNPLAVLVGSWTALAVVAAVAVVAGGRLTRRVSLGRVRLVSGAVLTVLAVLTAVEAIRA